jgi:hypothetical protein
MITVAILAPKYGTNKAILLGLTVFFVLAISYLEVVNRLKWFV